MSVSATINSFAAKLFRRLAFAVATIAGGLVIAGEPPLRQMEVTFQPFMVVDG